jgi:hypothetical protein
MRKFLSGIGAFFLFFGFIIGLSYFFNILIIKFSDLFRMDPSTHILILGDSHTKYAIDDSQLQHAINFSNDADSYYYSYLKLKAIKRKNRQIDTLLLAFSPHNLERSTENKWLLNSAYIKSRFRFYHNLMSVDDLRDLIELRAKDVMLNVPSIITYPIHVLRKGDKLYGGYSHLDHDNLQAEIKRKSNTPKSDSTYENAELEMKFLNKMIAFCDLEGIKLILLDTPIYFSEETHESFSNLFRANYSNVQFLDMCNFKMQSDCFGDLTHLNAKGAQLFSSYMNSRGLGGLIRQSKLDSLYFTSDNLEK